MFTSFEKLFMWFKKMFGDLNFMFNNVLFVLLHLRNQKNQGISGWFIRQSVARKYVGNPFIAN
jgi:hypothetical protein